MTDKDQNNLTLPGLELPQPGSNPIAQAALVQLRALEEKGLLGEEHAILAQLILGLAVSVGAQLAAGRLNIAGVTAAKELSELLAQLPEANGGALTALVTEIREAKKAA